ncbi:MAG: SGNH/GDSL hydrolase family protein [Elainellaceae cyanobacterium]
MKPLLIALTVVGSVTVLSSGCQRSGQAIAVDNWANSGRDFGRDSGATGVKQLEEPRPILAIGDSILEWNAGVKKSIPDVIGQTLGRPVVNGAVSGAHLSHPDSEAAAAGYDIRQQFHQQAGRQDWDWVVMNGGANDLAGACDRASSGGLVDEMISADGLAGEIPAFVRQVSATGSKVMYVGYYAMPDSARFGFNQCNDEIAAHNDRLARMAEAIDGVWFVSAGAVVSAQDIAAYDDDGVHPSELGSAQIGRHVAGAVRMADGE